MTFHRRTGQTNERSLVIMHWLPRDLALIIGQYEAEFVNPLLLSALAQLSKELADNGNVVDDEKEDDGTFPVMKEDAKTSKASNELADPWHSTAALDVLFYFSCLRPHVGLTSAQVKRRQSTYGTNKLTPPPESNSPFNKPIFSGELKRLYDTLSEPHCLALRDSLWSSHPSSSLVPGDIVALRPGCCVPADVRLLAVDGLYVDMSSLTGESMPMRRTAEVSRQKNPLEAANVAMFGSHVVRGDGVGVVTSIGDRTVLGSIAVLCAYDEDEMEDLHHLKRIGKSKLRSLLLDLAKQHGLVSSSNLDRLIPDKILEASAFIAEVPVVPSEDVLKYLAQSYERVVLVIPPAALAQYEATSAGPLLGYADLVKEEDKDATMPTCYRWSAEICPGDPLNLVPHKVALETSSAGAVLALLAHGDEPGVTYFSPGVARDQMHYRLRRVFSIVDGSTAVDLAVRAAAMVVYPTESCAHPHALEWVQPLREAFDNAHKNQSKCLVQ